MSGRPRVMRNLMVLASGEVAAKALGFVAFAHLARVLSPQGFGAVELAVALSVFFGLAIEFGLTPIGAREIARDPTRIPQLAAQVPAARLLLSFIAIPLMGVAAFAMGQTPDSRRLILMFAAGLLTAPWLQRWLFQGLERMAWISVGQVIRIGVFSVGVVAVVHRTEDLITVGACEIVAAAAVGAYFVVAQHRVTPLRLDFAVAGLRRLLWEAFPMGASQVVWALTQYMPTMLVAVLLGATETAWFGAAHRIALSLMVLTRVYHFNLFPTWTRLLGDSSAAFVDLVRSSMRVTAWAGIGLALTLSIVAGPVSRIVYGEAFTAAALPLSILIWLVPLSLLSGHARWALVAAGKQRLLLFARLAGAAMTLVGGLLLIPFLGAVGAAIAMNTAGLVMWLSVHGFAKRFITKMPLLGPTVRPAVLALGVFILGAIMQLSPWLNALVGVGLYVIAAPLIDPPLLSDFRRLRSAGDGHPFPVWPGTGV